MKLVSELHDFILFGIVFHKDAPENDKLVLKRSILGLGRVISLDVARVLEQIKSCLRYGGARFLREREVGGGGGGRKKDRKKRKVKKFSR